jgi:hypothetical protein
MTKSNNFVGIYKANNNNTGAVVQFKMGSESDCMFMELAKQCRPMKDPKPYDWENTKVTVKLGDTDIGKLLALFNGFLVEEDPKKEDLMLYHQNSKGNKIIKFKKQAKGYYMKVSIKEGDRNDSISLPISWDEAELIKIALTKGYEIILGW